MKGLVFIVRKIYLVLLVVILLVCSACSNASVKNAGEEVKDTVADAMDSNNKYVQMVKNGYREKNPDLSYDKAFSAFFGTPRWKYFKGEGGKDVVEFTGDCMYQDSAVKARIQFAVDEKNRSFEAVYLAFNEVPQNKIILATLIEKAFTYEPKQAITVVPSQANRTQGEVLYKGKTITNWIGARLKQKTLQDEFGALVDTGKARGGDYRRYDGITFFIDVKRDEIISIGGTKLEMFTVNGVTLDKDRAGLVRIFGNPQKEGQVMGGDDEGAYYMAYDYMRYSLTFYRSSPNGKVQWFEISNKKK